MGIHSTCRKGLVGFGVLAPLIGLGYYAADPQALHFTSQAEAHTGGFASSTHSRDGHAADKTRISGLNSGIDHLFTSARKGPRADRYLALTSATDKAKKPLRVASLTPAANDVTGSLPPQARESGAIRQSGKADRIKSPTTAPAPEAGPSPAMFLASLHGPKAFAFSGKNNSETLLIKPRGPAKLPRGFKFKGETEGEYQARQRRCLATAIYFEARGEPVRGQLAVAQVVMNRVRSSIYPDTVCGVVYQGQLRRTGCQFSFTCDGIADVAREKEQWLLANKLAQQVLDGDVWLKEIGHATHYHATYVKPIWRRQLDHVKRVGRHIFYRVRHEQIQDVLSGSESPDQGLALAKSG